MPVRADIAGCRDDDKHFVQRIFVRFMGADPGSLARTQRARVTLQKFDLVVAAAGLSYPSRDEDFLASFAQIHGGPLRRPFSNSTQKWTGICRRAG